MIDNPKQNLLCADRIGGGGLPNSPTRTRLPGFERLNEANQESLARTRQIWGMSEASVRHPTATQSTSFDNSRGSASASSPAG
ncbi:hypothetical protein VE04_06262, partial [Pseudogymnoascus sp. 24MN13]